MNENLKRGLISIPGIILSLIYIVHGIQALMISEEFVKIVMFTGIPESMAQILVFLVGVLEIIIAIIVLLTPTTPLLIFMALWPAISARLSFLLVGEIEYNVIITSILAILVYFLQVRKPKVEGINPSKKLN